VLPTYNERDNLESVVMAVLGRGHDVLIVDDNSPDGTGEIADRLTDSTVGVRVLHRAQKRGLGSAYVDGFEIGVEEGYDFILEMDADGSHRPDDLERLIEAARASNGLAIGSRYVAGGTIVGWSAKRRLLSKAANVYTSLLLGHRLRDWTSGYRCYSSRAIRTIGLQTILSNGFDFQIEMAFRCLELGIPVTEVPIRFKERVLGRSKASAEEINLGLSRVASLRWLRQRKQKVLRDAGLHFAPTNQPATAPPLNLRSNSDGETLPYDSAVIGVLAHNEEATIEACLRAILSQQGELVRISTVLVVASGCTDTTEEIVRRIATEDSRVRLLVEPQRSGKAAAINLLLCESADPIVLIVSGDVIVTPGSVEKLLESFSDPRVGMTGARPIPTNLRKGVIGNAVNLLWDLHHELSLTKPKLGEAVAFRRVFATIDSATLVDEATIERAVLALGLQLRYVPSAVVRNHGPETLREFIAQRTRIYSGHLALASSTGYHVSSMDARANARAAWRLLRRGGPPHYMLLTMALEAAARTRARLMRLTGRQQTNGIWHPLVTSKRVIATGHILRSHHDTFQRLQFRAADTSQVTVPKIKRLIRADDRIRVDRGELSITFRADDAGVRAVGIRLRAQVPGLLMPKLVNPVRPEQLPPITWDSTRSDDVAEPAGS
jgi:dolichol-phosphate mannosyltransferase